jgi:Protein of unknown function (DUF2637)
VTALAITPGTRIGYEPVATAGVDRVIRVSTAIAVLAVAGVAAYVSYWHAYAVVCSHGETGATARLEPATIDGLVYASSMVNLYAARHRLPVPALARWLLALGIVATLAANMAQGWSHGPVGAVIAAWPAVSLVGSYELLVWIIRTAAAGDLDRVPAVDHRGPQPSHPGAGPRFAPAQAADIGAEGRYEPVTGLMPGSVDGPSALARMAGAGRRTSSGTGPADHQDQAGDNPDQSAGQVPGHPLLGHPDSSDINAAAVAAYRTSVQNGEPLSERKLAGMFGKTSRRWARNRMAEARQHPMPA